MLWELESVVRSGCLEKTGADDLDLGPYLEVDIPSIHADNPKKMNAHSPPLESASCRTCQIHTVPPLPTRSQASNVHHCGHLQVCTHAGYSSSSLGPRWYPSFINLQSRRPSVHSSLSPQAKPTPPRPLTATPHPAFHPTQPLRHQPASPHRGRLLSPNDDHTPPPVQPSPVHQPPPPSPHTSQPSGPKHHQPAPHGQPPT